MALDNFINFNSSSGEGIIATILSMMLVFVIVSIASYIYSGFAYMALGKKAKLKSPGLAWIPGVGPVIIAFQASKMHWWPWLLIAASVIPFVGFIAGPALAVFAIIWHWKLFESVNKPGWWAILLLIPILNLVILGIAAWSKE